MGEAVTLALISVVTLLCGAITWAFKKITSAFLASVNGSEKVLIKQTQVLAEHCRLNSQEHIQIVQALKALNNKPKKGGA